MFLGSTMLTVLLLNDIAAYPKDKSQTDREATVKLNFTHLPSRKFQIIVHNFSELIHSEWRNSLVLGTDFGSTFLWYLREPSIL